MKDKDLFEGHGAAWRPHLLESRRGRTRQVGMYHLRTRAAVKKNIIIMQYSIGLGEVLFDCLPTGRKLGGAPANFVFHASQFFSKNGESIQGCAISAIGNDDLGKEVTDILDSVGLHYCLPKVDFPTGTFSPSKTIPTWQSLTCGKTISASSAIPCIS